MSTLATEDGGAAPWRNVQHPLTLEGRYVRLEPLEAEHLPALTEVGLQPDLWRWTVQHVTDEAAMQRYIDRALADRDAGSAYPFVMIDRASEQVVGSTRFAAIEPAHRRVEIGWTWLARAWQRTPINTESKYLLLRHAFETMGCNRVELKTDALNEQSRRAILRLGARQEGRLRAHTVTETGRVRDTIYFSFIAEEWPAAKQRLEEMLA